jgi:hypothetical protein
MKVRVSPHVVGIGLCSLLTGAPLHAKAGEDRRRCRHLRVAHRSRQDRSHHPKGQRYAKITVVNGKPVMRVRSPEYAAAWCLVCHGNPQGVLDMKGM